jgi:hypothetical protein
MPNPNACFIQRLRLFALITICLTCNRQMVRGSCLLADFNFSNTTHTNEPLLIYGGSCPILDMASHTIQFELISAEKVLCFCTSVLSTYYHIIRTCFLQLQLHGSCFPIG